MPELHILHEALIEYNCYVSKRILSTTADETPIDIKHQMLANLNFKFDKISFIIEEISGKIQNNITRISLPDLKIIYSEYEVDTNDICSIKKILRRINNRYYALRYRHRKKHCF
jgi:hypothetical protein